MVLVAGGYPLRALVGCGIQMSQARNLVLDDVVMSDLIIKALPQISRLQALIVIGNS